VRGGNVLVLASGLVPEHTFASFAIAAGIPTFEIARMMGTSVLRIEKTYGHLLADALDRARTAPDAFDAKAEKRGEARA
jgi:hypothetical protein